MLCPRKFPGQRSDYAVDPDEFLSGGGFFPYLHGLSQIKAGEGDSVFAKGFDSILGKSKFFLGLITAVVADFKFHPLRVGFMGGDDQGPKFALNCIDEPEKFYSEHRICHLPYSW